MVNFVETLFGLTAVCLIAALVMLARRRRGPARRLASVGLVTGVIAVALEIYLQVWH